MRHGRTLTGVMGQQGLLFGSPFLWSSFREPEEVPLYKRLTQRNNRINLTFGQIVLKPNVLPNPVLTSSNFKFEKRKDLRSIGLALTNGAEKGRTTQVQYFFRYYSRVSQRRDPLVYSEVVSSLFLSGTPYPVSSKYVGCYQTTH